MLKKDNGCLKHCFPHLCGAYKNGYCVGYSAAYGEPVCCPFRRISRKQHKELCMKRIARLKKQKDTELLVSIGEENDHVDQ